jgi:hypothetical protein
VLLAGESDKGRSQRAPLAAAGGRVVREHFHESADFVVRPPEPWHEGESQPEDSAGGDDEMVTPA